MKMSLSNVSTAVDNLPINPTLILKLKKANFLYAKKVLNFSSPELQRIAKISPYEANIILQAVCSSELKSAEIDALSMLNAASAFKNELCFFDSVLFDGIYPGTITEICGESGVGKTQLCLLLSINVLTPSSLKDSPSKVLYIHSEGGFPIQRFVELSESFKRRKPSYKNVKFLDSLILKKVYNLKETIRVLQNGIPELLQQKSSPKLVIIDSVAELLRGEYDSFNVRNLMIQQLAVEIWKLANIYKMAVVCINQVSGSVQKNSSSTMSSTDIPSLGLLWSNVLTTRLKLFRTDGLREESVVRALEVVYSAYHPRMRSYFVITSEDLSVNNLPPLITERTYLKKKKKNWNC